MSLKQTIYFMALVGGFAGLVCWALVIWVPAFLTLTQETFWLADLINLSILGGLIGGLSVWFADRWSGDQVVARWVIAGTFIGLLAGCWSGLVQVAIGSAFTHQSPSLSRILSWTMAGGFIGLGTGLRWVGLNKNRVLHALTGGLGGGTLGGIVFALQGGVIADLSQALGFMLTGIGITCGVTLAPVLLSDGVLKFMSSGDSRAQKKYGRTSKEWELQNGDRYLIGSLGADLTQSFYAQEVQIYLPDSMVASHHAIVLGRGHRFYIAPHPDNRAAEGPSLSALKLRGHDILSQQELRDGDIIVCGQTTLQFHTRKRQN